MRLALPFPRWRREQAGRQPRRSRGVLLLLALLALVAAFALWRARASTSAPASLPSAPIVRGNLDITVESGGTAQPARSLDLSFQTSGQVSEVLAQPGQRVSAGQPLARLDDRDLQLQVSKAEADLRAAQARLDEARNGAATPQDLEQARARLRAAEAQLQQARGGGVTAPDLRAAEAELRAAQARLEALSTPAPEKRSAAQFALTQAQTNLTSTRDRLSATKTSAGLDLERAADALRQAQSHYATARQNWEYAQATGRDPANPEQADPVTGKLRPNRLNDSQRQQYYDAFVQAEAALHSAEAAVAQAQVAYDTARQQEVVGVQEAEARLTDAQQQLDALSQPASADLTQARAAVDQARARLDKLRLGGASSDIAAAQAQVDQARAALEALTAPADAPTIAAAEAQLAQAQAQLDAARLQLDKATLVAPFDGTIAAVKVIPGSVAGAGTPVFALVDTSTLSLDIKLSESDVARVKPGQPVRIVFDALPERVITGTVTTIAPTATTEQGVVTYPAQVRFTPGDAPIKPGMSASATITVERRQNVLQVPSRAIRASGPIKSVQLLYGPERTPISVRVETGASDGRMTEIARCLDTNSQCLREGDMVAIDTPNAAAGPSGGGDQIFMGPAPAGAHPGGVIQRFEVGP